MLLRNFIWAMNAPFMGNIVVMYPKSNPNRNFGSSIITYSNTRQNVSPHIWANATGNADTINRNTGSLANQGICLGKGTTPVTRNDLTLAEDIPSSEYTVNSYNFSRNNLTNTYTLNITAVNELTINEIGIFGTHMPTTSAKQYIYLLARTVLPTPLVLQPNEQKTITVYIDLKKLYEEVKISDT